VRTIGWFRWRNGRHRRGLHELGRVDPGIRIDCNPYSS
jgi:hypothetical protein